MNYISVDDIKNMSDEEIRELNRKLGMKALKRFALIMGIKWVLIIGTSYISRKLIERWVEEGR